MRVLACPDSFKGTLSAGEAAREIRLAAERHIPSVECLELPLSDGGEGVLECLAETEGFTILETKVSGPMGSPVRARWAITEDRRGFVELAEASGLGLVDELDPLGASTYGTGELVLAALDADVRNLTIAIGGSATNDGGMGLLRALGVRFLDDGGRELDGCGRDLGRVASIDVSGLDLRVQECEIHVLCDVDNPLLGPDGATHTFGPQKGADSEMLERLEAGMARYAHLSAKVLGEDFSRVPGAGAAGGVGFACVAYLGARLEKGIEGILDLVGFDDLLDTVDLVVTGEGHADAQTAHGKVIAGVARHCQRADVPCVAIVGAMDADAIDVLDIGVTAIVPTVIDASPVDEALRHAQRNLALAADRSFSLIGLGRAMDRRPPVER